MVMSAMATGGAQCSNTDMDENEGKKVQNEGKVFFWLTGKTVMDLVKTEKPCQQLRHCELVGVPCSK